MLGFQPRTPTSSPSPVPIVCFVEVEVVSGGGKSRPHVSQLPSNSLIAVVQGMTLNS